MWPGCSAASVSSASRGADTDGSILPRSRIAKSAIQPQPTMMRPSPKSPSRIDPQTEPNHEAERKQATNKKVCDLHPSLITQAERTHVVAPRAVAGASGTLNQEYEYEEKGTVWERSKAGATLVTGARQNGSLPSFLNRSMDALTIGSKRLACLKRESTTKKDLYRNGYFQYQHFSRPQCQLFTVHVSYPFPCYCCFSWG